MWYRYINHYKWQVIILIKSRYYIWFMTLMPLSERQGPKDILAFFLFSSFLPPLTCFSHVRLFGTLWTIQPTRLLCPWDFPGKNTGVGCHFLLEGIFLTPGLNSRLPVSPALEADSLPAEPPGKLLKFLANTIQLSNSVVKIDNKLAVLRACSTCTGVTSLQSICTVAVIM